MTHNEHVKKALEEAILFVDSRGYGGVAHIMHDALELLKEQEAEIVFLKEIQWQTVHNMSNEDIGNAVRNVLRL